MFAYRGEVTSDNSVSLLTLLEREMEFSDFSLLERKRLFMFALENLQNISRHGVGKRENMTSLVVYNKNVDGYTINTGNALRKSEVRGLRRNLERINSLEPDKIREVYRNMLQTSEVGKRGGAGLGLMEMARKTGNRLDYDFYPIDDKYSYFILSKTISSPGAGVQAGSSRRGGAQADATARERVFAGTLSQESPQADAAPGEGTAPGVTRGGGRPAETGTGRSTAPAAEASRFDSRKVMQLERMMKSNNICFIWGGPMTYEISNELLNFSETTMREAELEQNIHKRVFATLIELLQNVAQHSPGYEAEKKYGIPIAMIRKTPASFIITSGNLIRKSDMDHLVQKLDMVNRYDEEGLKKLLKLALMGQDMSKVSTGYLGLLEMARRSGNRLSYTFDEVNDVFSYYSVTVRVRIRNGAHSPRQGSARSRQK